MPENKDNGAKYITLKEAAKLSGYAPDYLGQLIRKGKLKGKRIFLNEAWVTTEEDVRAYLVSDGKGKHFSSSDLFEGRGFRTGIKTLLYIGLTLSVLALLFMFYAFSSILDNAIREHSIRSLEHNAQSNISPP